MNEIKRYQVRGLPGEVTRIQFQDRLVDYWIPIQGSDRLLIAHDGQNIFDGKTSTHRGQTWKLAQSALRVSNELQINPPAIIAIFHSGGISNPFGRAKDLAPQTFLSNDEYVDPRWKITDSAFQLNSNGYLNEIFAQIIPQVFPFATHEKTAVIGSSMGGLATLYAAIQFPDRFKTALALSPHWTISDKEFAAKMVNGLPTTHNIWMSRGTRGLDREYPPLQNYVDQLMRQRGFKENFVSKVYSKSGHNERSWAKYVHEPLRFWLNS